MDETETEEIVKNCPSENSIPLSVLLLKHPYGKASSDSSARLSPLIA